MLGLGLALAGASVVSGIIGANQRRKAAEAAAEQQMEAADKALQWQKQQFQMIQETLRPFVESGTRATAQMEALSGAQGSEAQQAALAQIEQGPEFQAMLSQGENAILQNASATGGLRGGNTQAALAQFRPAVLSSLINQRFNRLGGLAQLGQASAAGQASAGMNLGNEGADLLLQQGAYQAGGTLAQGNAWTDISNTIMEGFGLGAGLADWGKLNKF